MISQVDYASALARAYNAWLLEEWCSPENGLRLFNIDAGGNRLEGR